MFESVTPSDLLSVAGLAFITALIVELVVKTVLQLQMGWVNGDPPTEKKKLLYDLYVNLSAVGIALLFSFLAHGLLIKPFTGETALLAFLNGLSGAVGAVGASEIVSNTSRLRRL